MSWIAELQQLILRSTVDVILVGEQSMDELIAFSRSMSEGGVVIQPARVIQFMGVPVIKSVVQRPPLVEVLVRGVGVRSDVRVLR